MLLRHIKICRGVFRLGLSLFIVGCTQSGLNNFSGITVIQPTGGHCQYAIAPAKFQTLESASEMRGRVGRVLYAAENLDLNQNILITGSGLHPIDTEFVNNGGALVPANLNTLFAASLYYSMETGYLLTRKLDPNIDLATLIPNFSDTRIIHHARRLSGDLNSKNEIYDNAEYFPLSPSGSSRTNILNYFFSYPTEEVKDVPLGLNMGVMNHEFSHLIFQHLFYEPGIKRNLEVGSTKPTMNTLSALDEGLADYFGFLAVKDPGYFLCSFPRENRDLAVPKAFTSSVISRIENSNGYFDSHEGGAIWASIQYEIGQTLGNHDLVGKSLLRLMSNLLECPSTISGNTLNFNFGDLARCHQNILSTDARAQQVARQVYLKYLGSYGAGL